MLSTEERLRYSKQTILPELGMNGQEKLKAAKVLVIGAGGLGCPVLQYLTAAGVGEIGIADGDVVDISNLQRQVLYTSEDTGRPKAAIAARKLASLNPNVKINTYPVFIDNSNILEIIRLYDLIIDGSDNFATRYLLNDACVMLDKPFVSGAIYKFEGQVSVFNFKNGPTYRCIFPEPPGAGESPNCADIGVIATLPGIIGTIQANEAIKIITGIGETLSGKLMVMDTLTMNTHIFQFRLIEANKKINKLPETIWVCETGILNISFEQLHEKMNEYTDIQLVDVRETEEHANANIGGINIPLPGFEVNLNSLNPNLTTIVYCGSGVRSLKAAKILLAKGFREVLNLEKGINHLVLT